MARRLVFSFVAIIVMSLAFDSGIGFSDDWHANVPTPSPTLTPTITLTPTLTSTSSPTATPTRFATVRANQHLHRVPMLMYHYVSIPPPIADVFRFDLSVTPQAFEEQIAYLASNGYRTVHVADVVAHLSNGTVLPAKPIVLTFDDGYADIYESVFPILKKYQMTATFYIIAQFTEDRKAGYATWEQLREMANAGNEIGSHSLDHLDLRSRSVTFLNNQMLGSKRLIESRLGIIVKTFAYPAGKYDARTLAVVQRSGYLGAVTETQGTLQSDADIFEMRRVRVRGSYSLADYAYWLNWFMQNGR
ncbi:MAG: polysaccharide deacetylase family protein [Chloroflexi bacterium]|nr:polysaccharide deacetylase family protein [Chloroflexota bacterium]